MSLLDYDSLPDLFLSENINPSFIPSILNDNMNDFLSELSQIAPKKKTLNLF